LAILFPDWSKELCKLDKSFLLSGTSIRSARWKNEDEGAQRIFQVLQLRGVGYRKVAGAGQFRNRLERSLSSSPRPSKHV